MRKNFFLSLLAILFVSTLPRVLTNVERYSKTTSLNKRSIFLNFDTKIATIFTLGSPSIFRHFSMLYGLQYIQSSDFTNGPIADTEATLSFLMRSGIRVPGFFIFACEKSLEIHGNIPLCENFVRIGMENIPSSWFLPLYIGNIINTLEGNIEKALPYYIQASQKPDVPEFIGRYTEKLAQKIDISAEELNVMREHIRTQILIETDSIDTGALKENHEFQGQ